MSTLTKAAAPLLLLVVLGCGGRASSDTSTNGEATPRADPPKGKSDATAVLYMSLEFEAQNGTRPTSNIFLVETNETGANDRHNLGTFDGECKDVTPQVRGTDAEVFLAFHCQPAAGQRGVLVHILKRRGQLVLLRAWLGTSKPTFDEFDQIGELPPTPMGVPLRTEHD